ncbi:hypothetical protein [Salmonella phage PMBT28]|nr:hypothetical protein [Salmonella phage PMBT28]
MNIKEITSQHGNDFTAVMVCEHCGTTGVLKNGYHDAFFHNHVIPNINCPTCDRNHYGESTEHGAARRAREHVSPTHLENVIPPVRAERAELRHDESENWGSRS